MPTKTKIKKVSIISAYFLLFWVIIPWIIIYSSSLLDREFDLTMPFSYFLLILGGILALFAAGMFLLSIFQLIKYGRGLPISALPPDKLVRKGIYLVWRHPIYLFFTLFFIGLAFVIRSGSMPAIILPLLITSEFFYITVEEKFLVKRYGEKYEYYKSTTSLVVPKLIHFLRIFEYLPFRFFFSLKIYNKENIPEDTGYFIISSHRNYLDPFFIILITGRPVHFVATHEIFRTPLSRLIFKKLHCIPKKRYRSDIPAAKKIIASIERDAVTGIFPEGQRSWTGSMDSFKPEVLRLLKRFQL